MLLLPPPSPLAPRSRLAAGLAATALAALLGSGAVAAPVDGAAALEQPDPYELALRWTLAGLGPAAPPQAAAPAAPRPHFSTLPRGAGEAGEAGVPAPGAYALMGLGLLGAGLAAHFLGRARRAQRGLSKKT